MFMGKESNLSKTKLFPKAGSLGLELPLKSRKEGGETPSHLVLLPPQIPARPYSCIYFMDPRAKWGKKEQLALK